MKRKILIASILAIAAVSIFATTAPIDAVKPIDKASPDLVLNTQGVATCFQQEGDFCGGAKMKSKLGLSVEDVSSTGIVSGIAKAKLTHFVGQDPGGEGITLKSNNISWSIDSKTNQISMNGIVVGDDKSAFKVEINGWYTLPEVGDEVLLRTTITGPSENIINGFTIGTGTDILELLESIQDESRG